MIKSTSSLRTKLLNIGWKSLNEAAANWWCYHITSQKQNPDLNRLGPAGFDQSALKWFWNSEGECCYQQNQMLFSPDAGMRQSEAGCSCVCETIKGRRTETGQLCHFLRSLGGLLHYSVLLCDWTTLSDSTPPPPHPTPSNHTQAFLLLLLKSSSSQGGR